MNSCPVCRRAIGSRELAYVQASNRRWDHEVDCLGWVKPSSEERSIQFGEIIISDAIYAQNIAAAREEGRAAGYAEAKAECMKVADRHRQQLRESAEKANWEMQPSCWSAHAAVDDVFDDIKDLAPTTTKETK